MASMEQLNNLEERSHGGWGIDKKIPVALIFVVVFQTLGFTWGAATLSSDVRNNTKAVEEVKEEIQQHATDIKVELDKKQNKDSARREHDEIKQDVNGLNTRMLDVERSAYQKPHQHK